MQKRIYKVFLLVLLCMLKACFNILRLFRFNQEEAVDA